MRNPIEYQERAYQNFRQIQPSVVKGSSNADAATQKRYLWNKLYSVFKFTLPKDWDLDWFRFWLFQAGSIAVIYTKEYGWICNPYGVTKINLYYHPAEIQVTNHALPTTKDGVIGVNAQIIYCMDDFSGLDDLITKYAVKLSQVDKSIAINLMNSNVALMYEADDKKQGELIKEAYGRATTGDPLVVVNKSASLGDGLRPLINNVKNTYIVDQLHTARRSIVNEFLTEIGIANANTDKRERLISAEVDANTDETKALCSVIYDNIKKCMDLTNEISNLGLNVTLRYGGVDNGTIEPIWDAPV